MGFTTGVTGGVTLTLGLAYLAVHTHQRNRQEQAQALRSQARVLNSLLEPVVQTPPPSRFELEAAKRANLIDSAKDKWNAEVSNAMHWVQHTDWTDVREGLEAGANKAWKSTFGDGNEAGAAQEVARAAAVEGKEAAKEAKGAWERAREKAVAAAEVRATEAREAAETRAAEAKRVLEAEAAQAKTAAKSAGETAKQEGEGLFQKAKKVVGLAEQKVEKVVSQGETLLQTGTLSPVERALQQRYEGASEKKDKSVQQVLDERYLPTQAKDYSQLRGL